MNTDFKISYGLKMDQDCVGSEFLLIYCFTISPTGNFFIQPKLITISKRSMPYNEVIKIMNTKKEDKTKKWMRGKKMMNEGIEMRNKIENRENQ